MNNYIWNMIEPVAGEHTGDVVRWLERQRNWLIEDLNGTRFSLKAHDLTALSDKDRTDLAQHICLLYRNAPDRPVLRDAKPQAQQEPELEPTPVPEKPKPQAAPKPRKEAAETPRREVDDETLVREILEYLREHRMAEFTYNQVADVPTIWCDFKSASRVLRRLKERGPEIIEYKQKDKKGQPIKLWKFAPERKLLDADYSRAQELVGAAILSFLTAKGPQSQNAICGAMKRYFGYIDKAVVKKVLEGLQAAGSVEENPGPRGAKVFAVVAKSTVLG